MVESLSKIAGLRFQFYLDLKQQELSIIDVVGYFDHDIIRQCYNPALVTCRTIIVKHFMKKVGCYLSVM